MRVASRAVIVLGLTCLLSTAAATASPAGGHPSTPARSELVGAWRLVAIDYRGPHGETIDPFYQAGSSGIIIYDSSGWMSVQIAAPQRRRVETPLVRVPRAAAADCGPKAEAFDTYYSYYGTWDYDVAASVVTHHLQTSVIPAETGLNYAQSVALEGAQLTLTVRSGGPGEETVRRKIWRRLTAGTAPPAAAPGVD
jgi:hypothetical protein